MLEPSSSEPEKYSLDEMMDRLKSRDSSDGKEGELVTRSDGSQAIKVKKRRRRSNQAVDKETKRNQKVQILQIAGFVVLLVVIGLAAGIGVLYANSTLFRESLLSKLETSSGAKVALKQFRMNPATANAAAVSMEWPIGNALSKMELSDVVAKVSPISFLGKSFSGEEIVASRGHLVVKAPTEDGEERYVEAAASALPVRFGRYSVPILDVYFSGEQNPANVLEKTEGSLYPSNVSGRGEIRLTGGLLKMQGWPVMELDRSYINVLGSEMQVQSMRFLAPQPANKGGLNKGYVDFTGTLQPLQTGTAQSLSAKMEAFRLSYLLGRDLGTFFLGNIDTADVPDSNYLTFTPGTEAPMALEVTVSNALDSRIDMSGFKFLSILAHTLEQSWYELPNFEDDVNLVVRREGSNVELKDINLVQRGRMAIRGSLASGEGGQIKGSLRVGVPETMIGAAPNKRLNAMFSPVREGYRWLDIEISGTSAEPLDNFTALFDAAASAIGPRVGNGEELKIPQDSFEDLIESR